MANILQCDKCGKIFNRELHMQQHKNRKNPCNQSLTCKRCSKVFKQKSNYTFHINRKNPCADNRISIDMQLKLEETKLKVEETKLKHAETELKIKQIDLKIAKNTGPSSITNNVGRDQINGDINIKLEQHFHGKQNVGEITLAVFTAEEIANIDNLDRAQMMENILKTLYNNSDKDMTKFQCIVLHDNKFYCKIEDTIKAITFDDLKPNVLKDIHKTNYNTLDKIDPTHRDIPTVPMSDESVGRYRDIETYISNPRNNGIVKKRLCKSVPVIV